MRSVLVLGLVALTMGALVPSTAEAKPRPGVKKGFRLFAKAIGAMTINRIYCGIASNGQVCVDSTNSPVVGGGFWPKGSPNQYVFNSGMQVAGIIGSDANPEWAGDTTGGQLFSPRGDDHGEEIQPVFNAADPADVAVWPQAGLVPSGDATQDLFFPVLRGRVSASQGDVWFVSWEGNPGFAAGREHPLGILVEQRGMGYNFPSGNQDILYFIYTFYNVTASDPAVYAAIRPGMRELVAEAGARFQQLNEGRFAVDIPDGGYTVTNMFAAFGADMDVAAAGSNYASVNVPFSLGYTYENTFAGTQDWQFDPTIFGPPFFPGAGFVGVKYLKSPVVDGVEVGLTLFSNTINSGAFDDAQNAVQLYRYLSNNISTAAGDAACNTGNPQLTRICFVNNVAPADMRFFQSSGPLELGPGQFGSIAVAYIFAAPVSVGACVGPGTCDLTPGDPTRLSDATLLANGANPVDSVAGFAGYEDANNDGVVQQEEIATVPGSLLDKAKVAQTIFNNRFLTPAAPESPSFFLIPGNNQVTVLWSPSPTETAGDPFFQVASEPLVVPEGGGDPVQNPLFDPNFREFDVEGYRVYRGRVDSPNSLSLLASFDKTGTVMQDFTSQVNSSDACAPELGINAPVAIDSVTDPLAPDTTFGCPVDFDSLVPGVAPTVFTEIPLVGPIIQVKLGPGGTPGARIQLASGTTINTAADTAITGAESGCLQAGTSATCGLVDNGVPFIFVDPTARNNLRYFYSVVAFDINSIQSGPSSIESSRVTKATTPVAGASNVLSEATFSQAIVGRGVTVSNDSTLPTIDATTGQFSGKMPPSNAATAAFVGEFARAIFSGQGSFGATLIGLGMGDARGGIPTNYTFETSGGGTTDTVSVQITQTLDLTVPTAQSGPFPAAEADPALSARFGIPPGFIQSGTVTLGLASYQTASGWGRGCVIDALFGANCNYNGPRWFAGDNETKADPNAGNVNSPTGGAADNNNAGELPGVLTIQNPQSYHQTSGNLRAIEAILGSATRAADFNLYWGAGGVVDSVIDITHNVPVPRLDSLGAGWGFLTTANTSGAGSSDGDPGTVTLADFGCVFPLIDPSRHGDQIFPCTTPYVLSNTAVAGPIAISGDESVFAPRPNPGFALYLAGHIFLMELAPGAGLPAAGTVWTMRSYIGWINGGNGAAGAEGPYSFTPQVRSFSALGATVALNFNATNAVQAPTATNLSQVHTVPDPYYVTSAFEQTTDAKIIKFVNLPNKAIIRIYSSSGVLVSLLEHNSTTFGGSADWNVRNRNNQVVASGVYFYHIEAGDARRVGRFTVVNFAQ
ncbi:MAG TPA: T9SS type A sorting domain-containing protein [Gemmatimonadales bacterium]|jgi:hypothetical protein